MVQGLYREQGHRVFGRRKENLSDTQNLPLSTFVEKIITDKDSDIQGLHQCLVCRKTGRQTFLPTRGSLGAEGGPHVKETHCTRYS